MLSFSNKNIHCALDPRCFFFPQLLIFEKFDAPTFFSVTPTPLLQLFQISKVYSNSVAPTFLIFKNLLQLQCSNFFNFQKFTPTQMSEHSSRPHEYAPQDAEEKLVQIKIYGKAAKRSKHGHDFAKRIKTHKGSAKFFETKFWIKKLDFSAIMNACCLCYYQFFV